MTGDEQSRDTRQGRRLTGQEDKGLAQKARQSCPVSSLAGDLQLNGLEINQILIGRLSRRQIERTPLVDSKKIFGFEH
jgi:hypothetical protein